MAAEPDSLRATHSRHPVGPRRDRTATRAGMARQRLDDLTADDLLAELSDDLLAESDLDRRWPGCSTRGMRGEPGGERALRGLNELLRRLAERARGAAVALSARRRAGRHPRGAGRDRQHRAARARTPHRRCGARRRRSRTSSCASMASDIAARAPGAARRAARRTSAAGSAACPTTTSWTRTRAQRFEELLDQLRKQVLDAQFAGLSDALKGMTPEDLAANRDMVRELNALLQERLAGGEPDVSPTSCRSYGSVFPGARRSTTSSSSSPRAWPRCSR